VWSKKQLAVLGARAAKGEMDYHDDGHTVVISLKEPSVAEPVPRPQRTEVLGIWERGVDNSLNFNVGGLRVQTPSVTLAYVSPWLGDAGGIGWKWRALGSTGVQPQLQDAQTLAVMRLGFHTHQAWLEHLSGSGYDWVNKASFNIHDRVFLEENEKHPPVNDPVAAPLLPQTAEPVPAETGGAEVPTEPVRAELPPPKRFINVCPRCAARPKNWHGADPKCAFGPSLTSHFNPDNWKCATVEALIAICHGDNPSPAVVNNGDQWACLLQGADCDHVLLASYKHRPRLEQAWMLNETSMPIHLTLEEAECILESEEAKKQKST